MNTGKQKGPLQAGALLETIYSGLALADNQPSVMGTKVNSTRRFC